MLRGTGLLHSGYSLQLDTFARAPFGKVGQFDPEGKGRAKNKGPEKRTLDFAAAIGG